MKYSIRYLPVPGEVKIGDLFKANHNEFVGEVREISKGKEGPIIHYKDKKEGLNRFTCLSLGSKVKLFLCADWMETMEDGTSVGEKVTSIGEISSEARWVDEKTELTAADIELWGESFTPEGMQVFGPRIDGVRIPWEKVSGKQGYKCIVKILGPCGHFH